MGFLMQMNVIGVHDTCTAVVGISPNAQPPNGVDRANIANVSNKIVHDGGYFVTRYHTATRETSPAMNKYQTIPPQASIPKSKDMYGMFHT